MAPEIPPAQPTEATKHIVLDKPQTIDEKISFYATKYNVSESVMRTVVRCESNFNPNAVGDYGQSFGLSQIYLPAHPSVTKAQALNPDFALNFLARELSEGDGWMWSCYRIHFPK